LPEFNPRPLKYFIIAGERSGDLHGANLLNEIRKLDQNTFARGIGGRFLKEAGMEVLQDYSELAIMGFTDVLEKLGQIRRAKKLVVNDLKLNRPDCLILIDYGGFNLRMAQAAKELGIKVFYYIPPKVWAWNTSRVKKLKEYTDRIFVILPFEKEFYASHGIEVDYVGNPVLDAVAAFRPSEDFRIRNKLDEKPIIAILPGSRKSEIESSLFRVLSILPAYPDHLFVVAGVDNLPQSYYNNFRRNGRVDIVYEQTYDLLRNAEMAVVTSGTATLETALFRVPQVVVFATGTITYWLARFFVKIKFISLVNLIAGRKVVAELIQSNFTPADLRVELADINPGLPGRDEMLQGYEEVIEKLGIPGASERCAKLILESLNSGS
jgi:lipid-A-disaccharide synthase